MELTRGGKLAAIGINWRDLRFHGLRLEVLVTLCTTNTSVCDFGTDRSVSTRQLARQSDLIQPCPKRMPLDQPFGACAKLLALEVKN
jgi:hypothetical protein